MSIILLLKTTQNSVTRYPKERKSPGIHSKQVVDMFWTVFTTIKIIIIYIIYMLYIYICNLL